MGKWWKYWLVALFYCNLTSCWRKMVQGRENTGCSMDKVSKLLCFAWLSLIFGVKHFWVHSIYYFMLLVQGVRLDWLVFHMISFLLMHILQGCILTFDERQPSMEESLSCQIFLLEITRGNVAAASGNATRVTIFYGPFFDWYFWTPLPPSITFAHSTLLG